MQSWMHMVDCVKPIIEAEEVEDWSDKVTRVVPFRVLIATIVLDHIRCSDRPDGILVRNKDCVDKLERISHQQRTDKHHNDTGLQHELPEQRRVPLAHHLEILDVNLENRPPDDDREQQDIEQVPFESQLAGSHRISRGLQVAMVGEVMSGDKRADRMPVSQGEHNLKERVQPLSSEYRRVDCVVGCDGDQEGVGACHNHEQGADPHRRRGPRPLKNDEPK